MFTSTQKLVIMVGNWPMAGCYFELWTYRNWYIESKNVSLVISSGIAKCFLMVGYTIATRFCL